MVNPRWRPTIANSRNGNKNYNEGEVKSEFNLEQTFKKTDKELKKFKETVKKQKKILED